MTNSHNTCTPRMTYNPTSVQRYWYLVLHLYLVLKRASRHLATPFNDNLVIGNFLSLLQRPNWAVTASLIRWGSVLLTRTTLDSVYWAESTPCRPGQETEATKKSSKLVKGWSQIGWTTTWSILHFRKERSSSRCGWLIHEVKPFSNLCFRF